MRKKYYILILFSVMGLLALFFQADFEQLKKQPTLYAIEPSSPSKKVARTMEALHKGQHLNPDAPDKWMESPDLSDSMTINAQMDPLNDLIAETLELATAIGPDAEYNYQQILLELIQNPDSVNRLNKIYQQTPETYYSKRNLLVEIMRSLGRDEANSYLQDIAFAAIPPEQSDDPSFSTVTKEAMIRMTAIVGLTELAMKGNRDSESALFELAIQHEDPAVVSFAIDGYLLSKGSGDEQIEALKTYLPEKYHYLIQRPPINIEDIPMPNISEFLETS